MKICLRYPFPKSLSSGKGLTIATSWLKVIFFYMSFVNFLSVKGCAEYENMSTLPFHIDYRL